MIILSAIKYTFLVRKRNIFYAPKHMFYRQNIHIVHKQVIYLIPKLFQVIDASIQSISKNHLPNFRVFTCIALAKAGLVVGPLRPSVRLSVRPSATLQWYQVCVICNSKSSHSLSFKLCLMIVDILKMCTSYFVHVS